MGNRMKFIIKFIPTDEKLCSCFGTDNLEISPKEKKMIMEHWKKIGLKWKEKEGDDQPGSSSK